MLHRTLAEQKGTRGTTKGGSQAISALLQQKEARGVVCCAVSGGVSVLIPIPVTVALLQQLCDHLGHVTVMLLQQLEVELPVTEAHLAQVGQEGCHLFLGDHRKSLEDDKNPLHKNRKPPLCT